MQLEQRTLICWASAPALMGLLLLAGCSNDLSRAHAARLIAASKPMAIMHATGARKFGDMGPCEQGKIAKGIQQIAGNGLTGVPPDERLPFRPYGYLWELNADSAKSFSSVWWISDGERYTLYFTMKDNPSIETTGITNDPMDREARWVDFKYSYPSYKPSQNVADCFDKTISGGSGKAMIKRYDDGWRITQVERDGLMPYFLGR
jgi:hypothetical protein